MKAVERAGGQTGGRGKGGYRLIRPITVNLLKFIRLTIGPESPIEDAAIARLHRAGLMKDGKVVRQNEP